MSVAIILLQHVFQLSWFIHETVKTEEGLGHVFRLLVPIKKSVLGWLSDFIGTF